MLGRILSIKSNASTRLISPIRQFCMKFTSKDKNPLSPRMLFINTWTSGALMIAGDIIQQEIEYQRQVSTKRYDWSRVGRMLIAGLALGPMHHYFYGYLIKIWPGRDIQTVTKKVLADQLIMSPVCIGTFFYGMGSMEGKTVAQSTKELKNKFLAVYTMDWCVWPPTQMINFFFVPNHYQVVYVNAVTMLYNVFLSYIKHTEKNTTQRHVNE